MRLVSMVLPASLLLVALTLVPTEPGKGTVQFTTEQDMLRVEGFYTADEQQETAVLHYTLEVLRDGPAGRSTTRQGGSFTSSPGQVDTLATSRVSVGEGDAVEATLTVSNDDETVAREVVRCTYPGCRTTTRSGWRKDNRRRP